MRFLKIGLASSLFVGTAVSQIPTYELILTNDAIVADSVLEFDMYLQRLGPNTFELATLQPMMKFNPAISSGTVILSMNPGSSELNPLQQPGSFSISGDELLVNARIPPGAGNGTVIPVAPGLRVGRFRLTSSVPFSVQPPSIRWKNHADPFTKVNAYVAGLNTPITDSLSHLNDLGNPPLPVQLASFTASRLGDTEVQLHWVTLSEINNFGFEVQTSVDSLEGFTTISNSFQPGHGTTAEPQAYSFLDSAASPNLVFYRLRQLDLGGAVHHSDAVRVDVLTSVVERAPLHFSLSQNYPNPFNPETTIKFSVEVASHATLTLFNTLGQEVLTLFDGEVEAGRYYDVRVRGTDLASGLYFYWLRSGKNTSFKKMLLLR